MVIALFRHPLDPRFASLAPTLHPVALASLINRLRTQPYFTVVANHLILIQLFIEFFGLLAQATDHYIRFGFHFGFYFFLLLFEIFGQIVYYLVFEVVYLFCGQGFLDECFVLFNLVGQLFGFNIR